MSQAKGISPVRVPGLSVFLPSHNEEGNVERIVSAFLAELPRVADNYEVIVVDDGSRDRTGEIADRLAAENPRVKVVHHPVNRGYGGAVTSGIRASTQPYVLLSDGDGQFDPADIERMLPFVPDYDVVAGHRARRADPLMRRINGKAWTMLVRALLGITIRDIDCGFKLFKRELLDGLELRAHGAMISTELMARLAGRGAKVKEVEVQHLPRLAGEQSGANLKVVTLAFKELFALYRELKDQRRSVS
ncbi:MAG: glycosyltransferase family 2 protein [Candidatus Binatus sp.]|uniref:glycosyltransferase family 2 protein n=1 Tax=Candidatus Binatus sp. TaxID=2811406 RepID=UPI002727E302|nr:glycosyltransferase family 2 protein [Candidatus Binatus sp.]MDO8433247.1 glycosyltransferase family 2 protein [Candidatus Binatus sp.]